MTYRIEVLETEFWSPAPGDSYGLTREQAEAMIEAGVPDIMGQPCEWDGVRIVAEEK